MLFDTIILLILLVIGEGINLTYEPANRKKNIAKCLGIKVKDIISMSFRYGCHTSVDVITKGGVHFVSMMKKFAEVSTLTYKVKWDSVKKCYTVAMGYTKMKTIGWYDNIKDIKDIFNRSAYLSYTKCVGIDRTILFGAIATILMLFLVDLLNWKYGTFSFASVGFAALTTNTFDGSTDGDMDDGDNWSEGHTLAAGEDGVLDGSLYNGAINGNLAITNIGSLSDTGGVANYTGTITFDANFGSTTGAINLSHCTVVINTSKTLYSAGLSIGAITNSGTLNLNGNVSSGDWTCTTGTIDWNSGNWIWTCTGSFTHSGSWANIPATYGTVKVTSDLDLAYTTDIVYLNVEMNGTGSQDYTTNVGNIHQLTISKASGTMTRSSGLGVLGDLICSGACTLDLNTDNDGDEIGGNITISNGFSFDAIGVGRSESLYVNGAMTFTDNNGTKTNIGNVYVIGTKSLKLASNIKCDDFYCADGSILDWDSTGYSMTCTGSFTTVAATTWSNMGGSNPSLNVVGNIDWTGSSGTLTGLNVIINGSLSQSFNSNSLTFKSLTISNSGEVDIVMASAMTFTTLTCDSTTATLDLSGNYAFNTAGNVSFANGFLVDITDRTTAWTFNGTTTYTDNNTVKQNIGNAEAVSGTITFASSFITNNWTCTSGTIDWSSGAWVWTCNGNFSHTTATAKWTNVGDATHFPSLKVTGDCSWNASTFTTGTLAYLQFTVDGVGVTQDFDSAGHDFRSFTLTDATTTCNLTADVDSVTTSSTINGIMTGSGYHYRITHSWANLTMGASSNMTGIERLWLSGGGTCPADYALYPAIYVAGAVTDTRINVGTRAIVCDGANYTYGFYLLGDNDPRYSFTGDTGSIRVNNNGFKVESTHGGGIYNPGANFTVYVYGGNYYSNNTSVVSGMKIHIYSVGSVNVSTVKYGSTSYATYYYVHANNSLNTQSGDAYGGINRIEMDDSTTLAVTGRINSNMPSIIIGDNCTLNDNIVTWGGISMYNSGATITMGDNSAIVNMGTNAILCSGLLTITMGTGSYITRVKSFSTSTTNCTKLSSDGSITYITGNTTSCIFRTMGYNLVTTDVTTVQLYADTTSQVNLSGTLTSQVTPATSTFILDGASTQAITNTGSFYNLQNSNVTDVVTFGANTTITNDFTPDAGSSTNDGGFIVTINTNTDMTGATYTSTGTLKVSTSLTLTTDTNVIATLTVDTTKTCTLGDTLNATNVTGLGTVDTKGYNIDCDNLDIANVTNTSTVIGSYSTTADFDAGTKTNTATNTDDYVATADQIQLSCPIADKDRNLVAYWRFEDDYTDETGVNNGTPTGSPTFGAGKIDQAVTFGAGKYVQCGTGIASEVTDSFSYNVWVKTSSTAIQLIMGRENAASPYEGTLFGTTLAGGRVWWCMSSDLSNVIWSESTHIISDNIWHMVTVTYDGSKHTNGMRIFIDGQQEVLINLQNTYVSGSIISSNPFQISGRDGAAYVWLGSVDEAKVYSRVLTPAEVLALYNSGLKYPTSGNDTTPSMTNTRTLSSVVLNYGGVDANNYIDKVEILKSSDDSVLSTYATNITAGATITLTDTDFDNGVAPTTGLNVKLKVYFVSAGTTTPYITDITVDADAVSTITCAVNITTTITGSVSLITDGAVAQSVSITGDLYDYQNSNTTATVTLSANTQFTGNVTLDPTSVTYTNSKLKYNGTSFDTAHKISGGGNLDFGRNSSANFLTIDNVKVTGFYDTSQCRFMKRLNMGNVTSRQMSRRSAFNF